MIMNILLITHFCVGFMVSEIPRVSVFGYFPLYILFLKTGDISITKKNIGITLIDIAAKIYNLLILNEFRLEIDPILRKKSKSK